MMIQSARIIFLHPQNESFNNCIVNKSRPTYELTNNWVPMGTSLSIRPDPYLEMQRGNLNPEMERGEQEQKSGFDCLAYDGGRTGQGQLRGGQDGG
jgi:hypothetical protein